MQNAKNYRNKQIERYTGFSKHGLVMELIGHSGTNEYRKLMNKNKKELVNLTVDKHIEEIKYIKNQN